MAERTGLKYRLEDDERAARALRLSEQGDAAPQNMGARLERFRRDTSKQFKLFFGLWLTLGPLGASVALVYLLSKKEFRSVVRKQSRHLFHAWKHRNDRYEPISIRQLKTLTEQVAEADLPPSEFMKMGERMVKLRALDLLRAFKDASQEDLAANPDSEENKIIDQLLEEVEKDLEANEVDPVSEALIDTILTFERTLGKPNQALRDAFRVTQAQISAFSRKALEETFGDVETARQQRDKLRTSPEVIAEAAQQVLRCLANDGGDDPLTALSRLAEGYLGAYDIGESDSESQLQAMLQTKVKQNISKLFPREQYAREAKSVSDAANLLRARVGEDALPESSLKVFHSFLDCFREAALQVAKDFAREDPGHSGMGRSL